jgi:peptide chain release factor 3
MDPNHRDRIAFVRLCSGKLTRGMKVKQVRTGKTVSLHAPQFFFAQNRALVEEAYAGDVVGIPNHGTLRIGDTLTESEDLNFVGVPNFAPEILRRVRLADSMRAKKLRQALEQLAEEGVAQVFRPIDGSPALVGVVGPLQLDVLKARLADEYGLEMDWSTAEFQFARWIGADDRKTLDQFVESRRSAIAEDFDGDLVFLARSAFDLEYTGERSAEICFTDVKDIHRRERNPEPHQE